MPEVNPGTTGLVAWWALDSGALVTDSHGANTLTNSGVAEGAAKVGTAAGDFESTETDSMYIADNADLSFGDEDFTICAWVNPESLTSGASNRNIISKWAWPTNDREYLLVMAGGTNKPTFYVSPNGSSSTPVVWGSALTTGTWYFITCWHDSVANQIGIAVNAGAAVTAAHATGCNDNVSNFELGRDYSDGETALWDGLMDEVCVYGRVLSADERSWLYNSGSGRSYADLTGGAAGLPVIAWHHHQVFGG